MIQMGTIINKEKIYEFISYIKQLKYIKIIELYSKNTDVERFWYKCGFKKMLEETNYL